MNWNFSLGWFFGGVAIFIAGVLIVLYNQKISDTFVDGARTYGRVKLVGLITSFVGFLVMTNLHTALLSLLVSIIFPGFSK